MMRILAFFSLIILLVMLVIMPGIVSGHAPSFPEGNESIATAMHIDDTVKSWAIYMHVHEGTAKYFSFDMGTGDRLLLNLLVPVRDGRDGYLPSMVLMAPGMEENGSLPSFVEVPSGYGYEVIDGVLPERPTYEAFSPSAFYDLGRTDGPAPVNGTYYVAVFSHVHQEGELALVIGYAESYTLEEMVLIPFSLLTVYRWEGQGILQILSPMFLVIIVGGILVGWKWNADRRAMTLSQAFALFSGLLFLGTAASTTVQMLTAMGDTGFVGEAAITMFLIAVPVVLGYCSIACSFKKKGINAQDRIKQILIGTVAIFVWAGYLIGPALAIVSGLLPARLADRLVLGDDGSEDAEGGEEEQGDTDHDDGR